MFFLYFPSIIGKTCVISILFITDGFRMVVIKFLKSPTAAPKYTVSGFTDVETVHLYIMP